MFSISSELLMKYTPNFILLVMHCGQSLVIHDNEFHLHYKFHVDVQKNYFLIQIKLDLRIRQEIK